MSFDVPPGLPLAVDASLLVFFRFFPFDDGLSWNVYMMDFSQFAVTVRQAGLETTRVPAGEFDCYRFEVVANVPVIKPKINPIFS
jgi:hypothetical protein